MIKPSGFILVRKNWIKKIEQLCMDVDLVVDLVTGDPISDLYEFVNINLGGVDDDTKYLIRCGAMTDTPNTNTNTNNNMLFYNKTTGECIFAVGDYRYSWINKINWK